MQGMVLVVVGGVMVTVIRRAVDISVKLAINSQPSPSASQMQAGMAAMGP